MEQDKKNVFISYTRADYKDENKNIIEGNPISAIKAAFDKAGITYWFDEDGVFAGDTFAPEIARAIHNCDIFLYISSERSNASEWTSNEIATAHAYKKKIIPFRVDNSVYNESVIIFIAKLDYIDYASNQSLAISRLVSGVTDYLTRQKALAEEKERKDKAEKERIRLLKEKEQAELATEIELSARELNTDEGKAQDKRRRITRDVQKIEDEETRNQLIELIDQSGPIHLSHKHERTKMSSEINSLKEEIEELNLKLEGKESNTENEPKLSKILLFIFSFIILIICFFIPTLLLKNSKNQIAYKERIINEKEGIINKKEEIINKYEQWIDENSIVILNAGFNYEYNSYKNIPDKLNIKYKRLPSILDKNSSESIKINIEAKCNGYKSEKTYYLHAKPNTVETVSITLKELFKELFKETSAFEGYPRVSLIIKNNDLILYRTNEIKVNSREIYVNDTKERKNIKKGKQNIL